MKLISPSAAAIKYLKEAGVVAGINVRPFFYQTSWFLTLCVIAVIGTTVEGYRWRVRRLRTRQQELEQLLNQGARELQERKRVEDELRRSEDKFAKAFRSSPAAMSIASLATGRLIDVNESFLKLLGFQIEEAVGRTAAELRLWQDESERGRISGPSHDCDRDA